MSRTRSDAADISGGLGLCTGNRGSVKRLASETVASVPKILMSVSMGAGELDRAAVLRMFEKYGA